MELFVALGLPIVILIGLIVIYNRKYNLRENFIKCYSGHEPAKAEESYNNVNKAWCKFTGIPDAKEIVIPKKYPSTIYDVSTELDPNLNYELIDKQEINGDFIESQAFAYLAIRSLLKLPISFPSTTGCKKDCLGGVLIKS